MLLGPTQPAPQATQLILVVNLASFVLMEKNTEILFQWEEKANYTSAVTATAPFLLIEF